jgi:hypothetical protein
MLRKIAAIIAGFTAWTVLWLAGNAFFFQDLAKTAEANQPITNNAALAGVLTLSIVCSLIAGLTAAAIARSKPPVLITAILLLLVGIAVQSTVWNLMPVWYHLSFLILLIPATLLGGRISRRW